jgi:beta-phosphoglucomutase-like phosphatase (HAD superfamily)
MTKDSTPSTSTSTTTKPIIALDCDGVLLDFHINFAQVYEKAFGKQLTVVSPTSYHVSLIILIKKII